MCIYYKMATTICLGAVCHYIKLWRYYFLDFLCCTLRFLVLFYNWKAIPLNYLYFVHLPTPLPCSSHQFILCIYEFQFCLFICFDLFFWCLILCVTFRKSHFWWVSEEEALRTAPISGKSVPGIFLSGFLHSLDQRFSIFCSPFLIFFSVLFL